MIGKASSFAFHINYCREEVAMNTNMPEDPQFNKFHQKHQKWPKRNGSRPKTIDAYSVERSRMLWTRHYVIFIPWEVCVSNENASIFISTKRALHVFEVPTRWGSATYIRVPFQGLQGLWMITTRGLLKGVSANKFPPVLSTTGRFLVVDWSVKGNGTRMMSPKL